jgi:hypothetical protein
MKRTVAAAGPAVALRYKCEPVAPSAACNWLESSPPASIPAASRERAKASARCAASVDLGASAAGRRRRRPPRQQHPETGLKVAAAHELPRHLRGSVSGNGFQLRLDARRLVPGQHGLDLAEEVGPEPQHPIIGGHRPPPQHLGQRPRIELPPGNAEGIVIEAGKVL